VLLMGRMPMPRRRGKWGWYDGRAMVRGIFITGTGTGVGKTVVAAAVLRAARAAGIDAVPFKPVQTGAADGSGGLRAPDVEFCLAAAGMEPPADEVRMMAPYLYKTACSPHLAASLEGRPVDVGAIIAAAGKLMARHEALVIEGAGGVMVPLNESQTMRDLMAALGLPVIIVALDGLGTINHTLLTFASLRAAGIEVLGVVFNRPEPSAGAVAASSRGEACRDPDALLEDPTLLDTDALLLLEKIIRLDNVTTIRQFGPVALGMLPHLGGIRVAGGDEAAWARVTAELIGTPLIVERLRPRQQMEER